MKEHLIPQLEPLSNTIELTTILSSSVILLLLLVLVLALRKVTW